MLEVLQSPDQVAALAVSGTLTGGDYDRVIAEVEAKLARHERIGVLMDLTLFEDFTAEAAWKDIRYDLSKLFELKRFPRGAVVSSKQWTRMAVGIASSLLPHVELRTFDAGARAEAMRWVSEIPS